MKGTWKRTKGILARVFASLLFITFLFGTSESFAKSKGTEKDSLIRKEVPASEAGASGFLNGELLVVFEKNAVAEADRAVKTAQRIADDTVAIDSAEPVADTVAGDGACVLVTLDSGESMEEAIDVLEENQRIAYVQPNFQYRMLETDAVNDSFHNLQYALGAWDESFQSSCGANVEKAWELMGGIRKAEEEDARHVTIAILDSGCQVTHEDLRAAVDVEHAYDAVNKNVGTEYITDASGHGTHVAGIAAGVTDNGIGIAGAAGNYAKILPINVFVGQWSSTKDMVTAFDYLEELITTGELNDLHVINMSLGGYGELDEDDELLKKSITRMRNKDVLTVCAGGNGDEQFSLAFKDKPMFPGDYEDCLCVTSLDSNGTNSLFSDYSMDKDISAPGSGILSTMTDATGTIGDGADAKYGFLSGTSMASPLVAGIAGLLFVDNPDLTCDQVVESVLSTAHKVNPSINSHEGETGSAGAIDAAAALQYAREKFDAKRVRIREEDVSVDSAALVYDGTEKKPAVKVLHDGRTLTEGEDYLVSYSDNVNAGTAHLAVTGIRAFIGTVSKNFEIACADIKEAEASTMPEEYLYDGQYHFPTLIMATLSGKKLKWGRDFTVDAKTDGIRKGTHEIVLKGKGNYTGSKSVFYTIRGREISIGPAIVKGIKNKVYNGKNQTQSPVVVLDGKTLAAGKDYRLSFRNHKNVGLAELFITGIGDYTGTLKKTFVIIPKNTKIKKLSAAKKALTVSWTGVREKMAAERITGYQIQVSAKKTFTGKTTKTITVNGFQKTSKKITRLKKGTKYYVRIRTFRKTGGRTYASVWSAVKAKKTK